MAGIEKHMLDEKKTKEHIEDVECIEDAKLANQREHETTFWQALKSNRKAAMWSAIISLTIIMEGYDIGEARGCLMPDLRARD